MPTAPSRPTAGARERLSRLRTRLRRMLLRRRRLLAAVFAALAVMFAVRAVAEPAPELVSVAVLDRALPAGATISRGDVTTVRFAPGSVPSDLVTDPVGATLAGPVARGEPVTDARLLGPQLTSHSDGLAALPIRLPDAGMVALLHVGDEVDLLAADPRGSQAEVVARAVPILAIPAEQQSVAGADALPGRLVVVGVPEAEVTDVTQATAGQIVTFSWLRR